MRSELGKWFEEHKVPDFAIVDKNNNIVKGFDYVDTKPIIHKLENIAQILKELESIGVMVGNLDEFPDFNEIAGREELKKIVLASVANGKEWLNPKIAKERGIFLYGPPGTGKTYFAKAAAKELSKKLGRDNVIYLEVNNIESPYVGETENRIRKLVDSVKKLRESGKEVVLVMDEVDRLAPNRAMMSGSAKRDTTNAFLTAINDLQSMGVHIFAMTNDPKMVDKAFIDRMSVSKYVPTPTTEEFKKFLEDNILDKNIKDQIDINTLAYALAKNQCSFRDAKSVLRLAKMEMEVDKKAPSEAIKDALSIVLLSKKDYNKSFFGPNT